MNPLTSRSQSSLRDLCRLRSGSRKLPERHTRRIASMVVSAWSDPAIAVKRDGTILSANAAAANTLGWSAAELHATPLSAHFSRKAEVELSAALAATFDGKRTTAEATVRTKASTEIDSELTFIPLEKPAGTAAVVIRRGRSQSPEQDQFDRISALGRLAANMAHEFNNVLMAIQPMVQLIERRSADEPVKWATNSIKFTIQRGKRVTEEILRYTRRIEPTMSEINVRTWLRSLASELKAVSGEHVHVRVRFEGSDRTSVMGDASQLNQVFVNLAVNAQHAMSGRGTLTIDVSRCASNDTFAFGHIDHAERYVHISVRDTGSGISPATLPHIFEPLFTTKKNTGTGLGLSIAHQIISKHNGHILVESTPGEGTTFHVFLLAGEGKGVEKSNEVDYEQRLDCKRIVLVEDDVAIGLGMTTLLEQVGAEVHVVHTGAGAVEAVRLLRPEAVILDIGLPDGSGIDVFHRLRALQPELPVVFSSGHGDESQVADLIRAGGVSFLHKPYEFDLLLDRLNHVTGYTNGATVALVAP